MVLPTRASVDIATNVRVLVSILSASHVGAVSFFCMRTSDVDEFRYVFVLVQYRTRINTYESARKLRAHNNMLYAWERAMRHCLE